MKNQEEIIKTLARELIKENATIENKFYIDNGHIVCIDVSIEKTDKALSFNEINELFDLFYIHLKKLKTGEENDFQVYKDKLLKINNSLIDSIVYRELRQLKRQLNILNL